MHRMRVAKRSSRVAAKRRPAVTGSWDVFWIALVGWMISAVVAGDVRQ
jgi:hypothetical protein